MIHLLLANAVFVGLRHFLRGNLSAVLILYDRFYIDSILNRSWHLSVISLGSQDIFGVTRQSLTPGGPLWSRTFMILLLMRCGAATLSRETTKMWS